MHHQRKNKGYYLSKNSILHRSWVKGGENVLLSTVIFIDYRSAYLKKEVSAKYNDQGVARGKELTSDSDRRMFD